MRRLVQLSTARCCYYTILIRNSSSFSVVAAAAAAAFPSVSGVVVETNQQTLVRMVVHTRSSSPTGIRTTAASLAPLSRLLASTKNDEDDDHDDPGSRNRASSSSSSNKFVTTPKSTARQQRRGPKKTVITPSTPSLSSTQSPPTRKAWSKSSSSSSLSSSSIINDTKKVVLTSRQLASVAPHQPYHDLQVPPWELRPSATLTTGQCFHWRVVQQQNLFDDDDDDEDDDHPKDSQGQEQQSAWGSHDATEWVGILRLSTATTTAAIAAVSERTDNCNEDQNLSIVVSIKEEPHTTLYRILYVPEMTTSFSSDVFGINNDVVHQVLKDYFQLHQPLEPLYRSWSKSCPRLKQIATCLPGVRIVEQDPWECLVSFICSSNNNIPRITQMVNSIRQTYGTPLITIPNTTITLYSFPSLKHLYATATEEELRQLGMGYRAKYLMETMQTLHSLGGESYLHALRYATNNNSNNKVVQEALCQFSGVGRKVADCVALLSLRQSNAIPVDTHVWNIARRDYDNDNHTLTNAKSLTPTIYAQVGTIFRELFAPFAGWAHSLLFVAELPSFQPILPKNIREEMIKFRQVEQEKKQAVRAAKRKRKKDSPGID